MYDQPFNWTPIIIISLGILALIVIWLAAWPLYQVWAQKLQGKADLEQAHYEQQIAIAQAKSRFDAAELNKKAAIIEAEAVAAQIEKIGTKLQSHDLYLKWQWIKMMEDRDGDETIYVPTEANLPILEATRRRDPMTGSEES